MCIASVNFLGLIFLILKCWDRTGFFTTNKRVLQLEAHCFLKKTETEQRASVPSVLTAKGQGND